MTDNVNHPEHYNKHPTGIECIDIIEVFPSNIASAIKYLWRCGLKAGAPAEEELNKAIWYIKREIQLRQRYEIKPASHRRLAPILTSTTDAAIAGTGLDLTKQFRNGPGAA